ncbi:MAG: hypothetical protein U9R42_10130 [Bacteroidota bacterium]|nr:hypothetical protein [Bacteroidota bacterium]
MLYYLFIKLNFLMLPPPKFKTNIFSFFILCFLIIPNISLGQQFFRVEADISIKTKNFDGSYQLSMGRIYYDKNIQKLVYEFIFPEKETWVIKDTFVYKFANNKLYAQTKSLPLIKSTIFHLSLNGSLSNFGLSSNIYEITNVEKDQGQIITTWETKEDFGDLGKVMISNKNKELFGVIFFNSKDKMLGKQFYKKYTIVNNLNFPTEIVQIMYLDGKENHQITTFKNIEVNNIKNENYYNYPLPASK